MTQKRSGSTVNCETVELMTVDLRPKLIDSFTEHKNAVLEVTSAQTALGEAEARLRRAEVPITNWPHTEFAFVLRPGSQPIERHFYSQDYDEDGDGGWNLDETTQIQPGEVFTAYNQTDVDYDNEALRLTLLGDQSKQYHGSMTGSGTAVKSEVVVPFSRLSEFDVYQYNPNNPERTAEICALMAAKLGVKEVVLFNSTLQDYTNVRRWAEEKSNQA